MKELVKFFVELLNIWKDILNKYELYLGGGTALMLKYRHRPSYDLDFFVFKEIELEKVLKELAFALPFKYDFAIKFPVLIVSNRRFSTKVEIHKRIGKKLMGFEEIYGIKRLSDLDILLEKVYFIERKRDTDIMDIKLLLNKVGVEIKDLVDLLVKKFNINRDYAEMQVEELEKILKLKD